MLKRNENIIHPSTETNYEKGIRLEQMFCEYMLNHLGFDGVHIRVQLPHKLNSKGTNVDIVARKINTKGKIFRLFAIIVFILFCGTLYFGIHPMNTALLIAALVLEITVSIFFTLAAKLSTKYAWVECKNLQTKVDYAKVQKALDEYDGYVSGGNREYKFDKLYFVSASGFIENALKLASDKKVICYILKDGIFEEVSYWNG